jgi:hypothetical protein
MREWTQLADLFTIDLPTLLQRLRYGFTMLLEIKPVPPSLLPPNRATFYILLI